jgi:hypothetical protein
MERDLYLNLLNKDINNINPLDRKFCNFIYRNSKSTLRNNFFHLLTKYKRVDAAGEHLNNIGYLIEPSFNYKIKFQSKYKFSIAFENGAYRGYWPGYTTEKIIHAMSANTIPLYHGNPLIGKEFNEKSFVNAHSFNSISDMIDYIIMLDKDDDMYMSMLSEPWITEIPEENKLDNFERFLFDIFS